MIVVSDCHHVVFVAFLLSEMRCRCFALNLLVLDMQTFWMCLFLEQLNASEDFIFVMDGVHHIHYKGSLEKRQIYKICISQNKKLKQKNTVIQL